MELLTFLYTQVAERHALLRLRLTAPPEPRVESGSGSLLSIGSVLRSEKRRHPLIVIASGNEALLSQATLSLEHADLSYSVFKVDADAAADVAAAWHRDRCDCFLAIGDADILELTKVAAVCIGFKKPPSALLSKKTLRRCSLPPLIAVPTASHGAETRNTLAIKQGRVTTYISVPALHPACLLLDPDLPLELSRKQIAASGLDGLCWAMEAYLTPEGAREPVHTLAASAIKGYLDALEPCWNGGGTSSDRLCLLEASHRAGSAAARTGSGFIRALCSAAYEVADVPFDTALGIFLPLVLEQYGAEVTDRLAELAAFCGIMTDGTRIARADAFLSRLRTLIFRIGLGDPSGAVSPELADAVADRVLSVPAVQRISPSFISLEACRRWTAVLCDDFHK